MLLGVAVVGDCVIVGVVVGANVGSTVGTEVGATDGLLVLNLEHIKSVGGGVGGADQYVVGGRVTAIVGVTGGIADAATVDDIVGAAVTAAEEAAAGCAPGTADGVPVTGTGVNVAVGPVVSITYATYAVGI